MTDPYPASEPVNWQCNLRPWKPGQSGNPAGKPKGTLHGRARALKLLDEVLAQPQTVDRMRAALTAYVLRDPVRAFRVLVMPLLPREARFDVNTEPRRVIWQSFLDAEPATEPKRT